MDLSKVKSGNDFLMQMYQDNQISPENSEIVDNAGATAADVDNENAELEIVNDASSDTVNDGNADIVAGTDTSTDDLIDNWDDTPATTAEEPKFDFSSLGKELELDGIDSKDTLVAKFKEVIKKSKELEQKAATLSSIPEPLQEAIEIANKGGDYLEYLGLSTIDYDAIDDRALVEDELIGFGLFKNPDGSVNEEALAEYVDRIDEKELLVRGAQIRVKYKREQEAQRQAVQVKQEQKRTQAVNELRGALDKVSNVGPFKLSPNHKKELFDSFVNGKMMKELFHDKDGKFDYAKAIRVYFKEKYADKIDKLTTEALRNQVKKQEVASIKNVDITSSNRIARPEPNGNVDPMDAFMRKLQGIK